ncbi:MAG: LytTR family DNA-binding domain-containing protein [Acidobacteriota bacterium]
MEKIRVLIIDDEPLAREGVRMRLLEDPEIEIVGECADGREAVSAILTKEPQLIFLDVQMPVLDGFAVLKTIGIANLPVVIFVTAYDEYAVQAFEVHALDYLLKPIDRERFLQALIRAKSQIRNRQLAQLNDRLQAFINDLQSERKYVERLAIKSTSRIFFLDVSEIRWIEAADNYVNLHSGRESYLLHMTMSRLETILDPAEFIRVHRSAIVNFRWVKELHPLFHGEYKIILKDGSDLTSGRSYQARLQKLLENSI